MKKQKQQKYFNLTVYCNGATPGFIIDEQTLKQFEDDFKNNKPTSSFISHPQHSEVVLRNHKLVGYEKSTLSEENCKTLEDID